MEQGKNVKSSDIRITWLLQGFFVFQNMKSNCSVVFVAPKNKRLWLGWSWCFCEFGETIRATTNKRTAKIRENCHTEPVHQEIIRLTASTKKELPSSTIFLFMNTINKFPVPTTKFFIVSYHERNDGEVRGRETKTNSVTNTTLRRQSHRRASCELGIGFSPVSASFKILPVLFCNSVHKIAYM